MNAVYKLFSTDKKLLVVEDNPITQEVISAIFANLGLKVEIADTGEKAVARVNNWHFDMVFMDLHLPHMSGNQAAIAISKLQPGIPIVAITADTFAEKPAYSPERPLRDYLSKPVDIDKLINVLNTYIPSTGDAG